MSVWRSGALGSHMATLPPVPPAPPRAAAAAAAADCRRAAAAAEAGQIERDVIARAVVLRRVDRAAVRRLSWYAEVPDAVATA